MAEVFPAVAVTWRGALGCVNAAADAGVAAATNNRKTVDGIRVIEAPIIILRMAFIVSVRLLIHKLGPIVSGSITSANHSLQ